MVTWIEVGGDSNIFSFSRAESLPCREKGDNVHGVGYQRKAVCSIGAWSPGLMFDQVLYVFPPATTITK